MGAIVIFISIFTSVPAAKAETAQHVLQNCSTEFDRTISARRHHSGKPESDSVSYDPVADSWSVDLRIHFRIESFVGEERLALIPLVPVRVREALDLTEQFYARYGIDLQIEATFDLTGAFQPEPVPEDAHLVFIRPFRGDTMNSLRWGLNPNWEIQDLAKIYSHELTHLFGILDEYEKPHGINQAELGEEDSFMRNWDHPEARMYPRHIEQIFEPLCE